MKDEGSSTAYIGDAVETAVLLERDNFELTNDEKDLIKCLTVPVPSDERYRINVLRQSELLDSNPCDSEYDRYTGLAQRIFNVPTSFISLVEVNRQWFKSRIGLEISQLPREDSFCAYIVAAEEMSFERHILVVPDTHQDARFKNNPFVMGPPYIAFYAGAPLVVAGARIGSLCVVDTRPRPGLSAAERQNLIDVAHAVAALMTSRRDTRLRARHLAAIGRAEGRSYPLPLPATNSLPTKDITPLSRSSSPPDSCHTQPHLAPAPISATAEAESSLSSDLEESLKCGICYDIICYARSLTPCMHTYCGKCISEWFGKAHPNCPSCSQKIERVHRNRIVDNQVELLLARYPNKARSAAELAEWSVRNTIQCNMPLTVYNSLLDDIIEAVDHDEEPRLRDLLAHLCKPSDVDEASEEDGMTPLMWACFLGRRDCAAALLDKGANAEARDREGCSCLMAACNSGHEDCVTLLCERRVDLNLRNNDGSTALMLACNKGYLGCATVLCDAGADLDAKQNNGWNAMMWAGNRGHRDCLELLCQRGADLGAVSDANRFSVLMFLCLRGYHECVRVLCQPRTTADGSARVEVNLDQADRGGNTALMAAADHGHPECVQLLCEAGACVDLRNEFGLTAVAIACGKGHEMCVTVLCQRGADLGLGDREGKTPLMVAARLGFADCAVRLLQNGADMDAIDAYGQSAMDYASAAMRPVLLSHCGHTHKRLKLSTPTAV